ncbi:phage tail sheath subtilisin-like domain-containing protein [Sphingomonas sp.]|jgi:phage tail sheath protein FI|uniref:phage tail sheath subtilisin-like domain-containing protein n=1 Tax=Sphingomonas sp. TaxID=28214 RepID=UPI002635967B|nr:phage tail sheath subtilisin-like domain-containing protein [Sphingomonas sp.]MDF2496059.1 phage tail protein [Sphingomonas sp.]
MSFFHGISVTEVPGSRRTIATVATAVIGLVATAPAADAAVFPLDTPVKVTVLGDAIAAAGATGTLRAALEAIADQVRTTVVVVRVAPGADAEATEAAVIGADVNGVKTGLQALLAAEAQIGVRPRIIGAPGLDTEDVAEALADVAKRLRAMAYAAAIGADRQQVAAYRANFDQRELMLIWPDFTAPLGLNGADVPSFAVARALGLRAAIDQTQGWHKTLSNVPVAGVDGLTKDVQFDIQDPDCDANILNAAQVTTIVRLAGELRFWGNRTCADPASAFTFESATRTAQILADSIVAGMLWAMDKPLTPSLAKDIVEEINAKFRELKREGKILGAVAEFRADKNPVDTLKQGKLLISYRYTPVPPLEHLAFEQEISDEFFADFAALVANG